PSLRSDVQTYGSSASKISSKRAATSCVWARAVIDSRVPGFWASGSSEKLHEGRTDQPGDDRRVVDPLPVHIEDERRDRAEQIRPDADGQRFTEREIRGQTQAGSCKCERFMRLSGDVDRVRLEPPHEADRTRRKPRHP